MISTVMGHQEIAADPGHSPDWLSGSIIRDNRLLVIPSSVLGDVR